MIIGSRIWGEAAAHEFQAHRFARENDQSHEREQPTRGLTADFVFPAERAHEGGMPHAAVFDERLKGDAMAAGFEPRIEFLKGHDRPPFAGRGGVSSGSCFWFFMPLTRRKFEASVILGSFCHNKCLIKTFNETVNKIFAS